MLMTYDSTAGLTTVGYAIINDDKTTDTALTTTGVTEMQSGSYGVNLADSKAGKTIQWYEDSVYQVSERIPSIESVTLTPSAIADAVCDEALSGHTTAGTLGAQITSAVTKATAIQAKTDNLPASPAAVGSAMTLTVGERGSIADAVLDEDVTAHLNANSFGLFLSRIYRYFFGKRVATNSQIKVYAHDGTTLDATMSVSGDASTITKGVAS